MAKQKRYTRKKDHVKAEYESTILYQGPVKDSPYKDTNVSIVDGENMMMVSLLESEEVLSFMVNRQRKGVSKNGKPWSKWENCRQVTVSTRSKGKAPKKLNVYAQYLSGAAMSKSWFTFRNVTNNAEAIDTVVYSEYLDVFNEAVVRLYEKNIGTAPIDIDDYRILPLQESNVSSSKRKDKAIRFPMSLAYPAFALLIENGMKVRHPVRIPAQMTMDCRSDDMQTFTMKTFGKENYRKDLVKAVSQAAFPIEIVYAKALRGLVPTDWIINYLKEGLRIRDEAKANGVYLSSNHDYANSHTTSLRKLFASLDMVQRRRLLNEFRKVSTYLANDTCRMIVNIKKYYNVSFVPGQIPGRSWQDVHDFLSSAMNSMKTPLVDIQKIPLAKKIEKIKALDGISLKLPSTNHELMDWGSHMGHCIGSYANDAVKGSSVFLALMSEGQMIGNAQIQVQNMRLMQVFGKRNSHLSKEVLTVFKRQLVDSDIIKESSLKNAAGWDNMRLTP